MHMAIEPPSFPWGDYHRYTFSLGIDTGRGLHLSGHTASMFDPDRRRVTIDGDAVVQLHTVYDKVACILAAKGRTLADVDRVVEYLTPDSVDDHAKIRAASQQRFGSAHPVVTTVCVDGLLRSEATIEVAVIAAEEPAGAETTTEVVYLPTILPETSATTLTEQTSSVLAQADAALREIGAGWADVAFAMEHVGVGADRDGSTTCLELIRRTRGGRPAGARIFTGRRVRPGALTQLDLVVSRRPVDVIDPDGGATGPAGLPPAVRTGDRVYLSAQSGTGSAPPADGSRHPVPEQIDRAYRDLLALLAAAGGQPSDLVETVEYVTARGISDYPTASAEVRRRRLPEPYTAATGVVCTGLDAEESDIAIYGLALLRGAV